MWITRVSIKQPVFATMVMLAIVVLGLFSYRLLPVEQMPDVAIPQVYITVEYPGASPEAIENDVVKPIENVVNSINGVKNIYATAREGLAFMSIDFRLDVDIAERIRLRLTREVVVGHPPAPVTASLGVARLDGTGTLESLQSDADAALYRAKQGGRNRVEIAA